MKYYLSHITDTTTHEAQFELDLEGNRIAPYGLVAGRAYVMLPGTPVFDEESGMTYETKIRSTDNRQSVALIATTDDFIPVSGQTLYEVSELETVKTNHPQIDYSMLGQAWVNGVLIP